jgi:hypothetical protein
MLSRNLTKLGWLGKTNNNPNVPSPFDTDALAYITAVETADTQALEAGVKTAINDFIVGTKADGIWDAIKSSAILAGARTLSGALVPLKGTAPTNFNFVSGDYNRKTGLVGNGSTKYLNSNRAPNASPQDNAHATVFVTAGLTVAEGAFIGAISDGATGGMQIVKATTNNYATRVNSSTTSTVAPFNSPGLGFLGVSRASSSGYTARVEGASYTIVNTSNAPISESIHVFQRNFVSSIPIDARLSFYSIGESLDLALLDTRVTQLMTDLGNAIP